MNIQFNIVIGPKSRFYIGVFFKNPKLIKYALGKI